MGIAEYTLKATVEDQRVSQPTLAMFVSQGACLTSVDKKQKLADMQCSITQVP